MTARYANEQLVSMPHASGVQVQTVIRRPHFWINQPYITYTLTAADAMWTIADRYYLNSQDWWVIADLNPHFPCPDDLLYGMTLLIPVG
jgi:hypothetical protein